MNENVESYMASCGLNNGHLRISRYDILDDFLQKNYEFRYAYAVSNPTSENNYVQEVQKVQEVQEVQKELNGPQEPSTLLTPTPPS